MALDLLQAIHARRTHDFVGVGIVLYVAPLDIPAVPLGGWASPRPALPVKGTAEISSALAAVSAHASAWHDGFHFVDVNARALTQVSQFLAPDLERAQRQRPDELPTGARQLSALLVSGYRSVQCVGLLTADEQISIYQRGRLHSRAPAGRA